MPPYQLNPGDIGREVQYPYPPSSGTEESFSSATRVGHEDERMARTPSPTPSELEALKTGALDWKVLSNWRFWIRKEWILYYIIFAVIIVVSTLMVIFHTQIVHWLTPAANWMHGLRFGWLIPIAILFVISFPPLFGHEIVAVLCGVVWGLGVGFAIVSAGTFLGEVGNFYAFKYCCRSRGEKLERTKISYACLAKVVRDGGFTIALVARLSAIPGHFTTAVFATCGMHIITFSIAAILSMPKQFVTVYLGVILESSSTGTTSTKSKIISDVVVAVTILVTFGAMWWILHKMNGVKPQVIHDRRKARQTKLDRVDLAPYRNSEGISSTFSVGFNPHASESNIPLKLGPEYGSYHQQWDKAGRAVGYAADPLLYAPQPKRATDSLAAGEMSMREDEDRTEYSHYSPGPGYGHSFPRETSHDSWDTERGSYDDRQNIPPGISPAPLNQFSKGGGSQQSSYPPPANLPSLTVSPPPHQQWPSPSQPQSYQPQAADFMPSPPPQSQFPTYQKPAFDPLSEPSYSQTSRTLAPSTSNYYVHGSEGSDDSFHSAVASHSRMGTEIPLSERTTSPPNAKYQSDLK